MPLDGSPPCHANTVEGPRTGKIAVICHTFAIRLPYACHTVSGRQIPNRTRRTAPLSPELRSGRPRAAFTRRQPDADRRSSRQIPAPLTEAAKIAAAAVTMLGPAGVSSRSDIASPPSTATQPNPTDSTAIPSGERA
jgi:hypothetical protein